MHCEFAERLVAPKTTFIAVDKLLESKERVRDMSHLITYVHGLVFERLRPIVATAYVRAVSSKPVPVNWRCYFM